MHTDNFGKVERRGDPASLPLTANLWSSKPKADLNPRLTVFVFSKHHQALPTLSS